MSTTMIEASGSSPDAPGALDPKRFRVLAIIAVAQLMIVLDASVVAIALPSAQRALHISIADRQWVLTAYTLAFGGLLLLGGRIADFVGRRRMFVLSLLGFAEASALGGLAQDPAMLFGARTVQGAFAAIMAPAALSLLTVTFTEPHERARAFGVYGAVAGGGAAIGLILGGILTEYASWRWTLLINVPIALVTAALAQSQVRESRAEGRARYDLPGALTVTGGLVALVYGFTRAESDGWGGVDHRRAPGRRGRPVGEPRDHRAPRRAPAAAPSRRARPQPRRLVPRVTARRDRDVRDVPLPHLLPAGDAPLLGA